MINSQNKLKITKSKFPNTLASNEEKNTNEFGLGVAKAIMGEWFSRTSGKSRFYTEMDNYHKLRLYSRGEQSVQKYKTEFSVNGDLSYINLDWTPVPIIPKFVDIVVNGMTNRGYDINAYAQDSVATTKRENYILELQKDMLAKNILDEFESELGVSGFVNDKEVLPETDEELEVHMELNYKQNIEVAEEIAINNIFDLNSYDELKKRIAYDLVTIGVAGAKREFNPTTGIQLHYVNPSETIYSASNSPYSDDIYYVGEVKKISKADIKRINPDLSNDDLEKLSSSNLLWNDYNGTNNSAHIDDTVEVLYFTYKTSNDIIYKVKQNKNGGNKAIKRDGSFKSPRNKDAKFKKIVKTIDVEYNGIISLGSQTLIKWELAKNMVRPKSASIGIVPTYSIIKPRTYNGINESLVQRMIPFADLIQITHLKLQQVISKVVPDGVYIDVDGIADIDLGDGGTYNPTKALEMFLQTGSVIGRTQTSEGDYSQGSIPIKELSTNSGNQKIQSLITTYNHYLQSIRDVTGLNEAIDASTPSSESLVGVQKLAILNSNTATRHIQDAGVYITKKLAQGISYMISDILEVPDLRKSFISSIGKVNVNILDDIKQLHNHDFGIFIELAPDDEERAQLENNMQQALVAGQLDVADIIDIREIRNLKLANQLLKIRRNQNIQLQKETQHEAIQAQSQANMQLEQQKTKAKMDELQANMQSKIQIDTNLKELEAKNKEHEARVKAKLMMLEFNINMKLKGLAIEADKVINDLKEDRKDERQNKHNSNQSQMIEQRKRDLGAINFESTEDTLDGFNLNSFEPK